MGFRQLKVAFFWGTIMGSRLSVPSTLKIPEAKIACKASRDKGTHLYLVHRAGTSEVSFKHMQACAETNTPKVSRASFWI